MIRMFSDPISATIIITAFLAALTIHEFAHGYAAHLLGDDTAKRYGRLTFNPLKHLDIFGTILILFAGIGWAKPVPINPYNFKDMKIGTALTAAAGPASNFIFAVLAAMILRMLPTGTPNHSVIALALYVVVHVNILLGLFNLLPIPPLDGSKIIGGFMPDNMYFKWLDWEKKGAYLLMIIIAIGIFTGRSFIFIMIGPPMNFLKSVLLG